MNIADLKTQRRWVCYDASKAPIDARTGRHASVSEPATWATYAEATAAVKRHRCLGVGVVFTGDDGVVGIDLDDCLEDVVDDDGVVQTVRDPYARHLMELAPTYAEISPSGTGIHIIGTGALDKSYKQKQNGIGVEMYDRGRYFTFTEDAVIENDTGELRNVQAIIDAVFAEDATIRAAKAAPQPIESGPAVGEMPEKWLMAIVDKRVKAAKKIITDAPDGGRHHARFAAGRLLGGYLEGARQAGYIVMTDDDAIDALYECRVPARGAEAKERHAIADGLRSGQREPVAIPLPAQPITPKPKRAIAGPVEAPGATEIVKRTDDTLERSRQYTDVGNAHRLVRYLNGSVCYVPEWKTYLEWDGRRWARIDAQLMKTKAHAMVLEMYHEAGQIGAISELGKWAIKSDASPRIEAMISEAQPYLIKHADQFDRHPELLNVGDCVVDLRTGQDRNHDAALMMTKIIDVPYRVDTGVSLRWLAFLRTIFRDDENLINYIQRAVGYTLTGLTDEHCLFFCYGDGANGKSTFMRALSIITGDYGTTSNVEALLDTRESGEGATPMVAALQGMRFAMASEMPEGRRLNESRVKDLSGGDTVTARVLYGQPFTFRPTHTLWITGNHKPRITGTDGGIWRRLRIIPFVANIPTEHRRPSREFEDEFRQDASAILQWAIVGAMAWFDSKLGSCHAVDVATNEYRGEEDTVARFLATVCVIGEKLSVRKSELYGAWKEWAEDEGERDAGRKSQRWLTAQLMTRGMSDDRTYMYGLGIVTDRYGSAGNVTQMPTRGQIRRGEA